MNILFLSILCFASAASGQPGQIKTGLVNTDTIKYPAAVFAYADQELVEPFSWEGVGSDTLYVIDGNGTRVVFHPRPSLYSQAYKERRRERLSALSQAQRDSMRAKAKASYQLDQRALAQYRKNGPEAMIAVYESDPMIDHVETLSHSYKIVYKDGDEEYLETCSDLDVPRPAPKSRAEVHQQMIDKFLAAHELGATIWFGTSHRITWRADFDQVEAYREAIRRLKRGEELTPEQLNTPAGYDRGIQYDATH